LQGWRRLALFSAGFLRMGRRLLLAISCVVAGASQALASGHFQHAGDAKLDQILRERAHAPVGHSRVILTTEPGATADEAIRTVRGTPGRRLRLLESQVADVPDQALDALAALPGVKGISLDRPVQGTLERTGATIGSGWVHDTLGIDGTGVGVAIIDSGITAWHDDLAADPLIRFADFVNFQPDAYDDYGHGTHVAGIIAGSGYDSGGRRRGIAPGASLVVEKVLDANGEGYISNVIAAIDYAVANRVALNIRVINLSVAAGVYESFNSDPLTIATKRAVEAGIVVVTAAGNLGRTANGLPQYGGIGAPGNAPWVITVGASSHMGTPSRTDDIVAGFSSRGPAAIDFSAKPDLVAPGVGIESLADAGSTLYLTKPAARLWGTVTTATEPYLSLTGTSMASPVVSGTIALMLQANPTLTPNLVKAILQYTAEVRRRYDGLTQGAGFLNARGAVELAQSLASGTAIGTSLLNDPTRWSGHIVWGNHRVGGGLLQATANAWRTDVIWGSTTTPDGEAVNWGASCVTDCDDFLRGSTAAENIVWATAIAGENIVRGTGTDDENIVWGTDCGGQDCRDTIWGTTGFSGAARNIVWGTSAVDDSENIVWGTNAFGNVNDVVWPAEATRHRFSARRFADMR
jgi:subtilisin family serine protease